MIDIVGDNELDRHMWLESLLKQGVYQVTFTKLDGTTRSMPCTLKQELLPVVNEDLSTLKPKFLKLETMNAWVTDINQWRSFRVMNVIEIKPL